MAAQLAGFTFLKTLLCCNWTTRDLEEVIFDAPNKGNRLPYDSCAPKKKDILHPDESFMV